MLLHAANPAAHSPLVVWRCTPLSYCCFILSCNSLRGSVLSHPLGQRLSCWSSEAGLWLGRETMLVKLILSWWPRGRHIPTASLSYICRLRLPSCRGLLLVRHCPWSFYGSSSVNQLLESFVHKCLRLPARLSSTVLCLVACGSGDFQDQVCCQVCCAMSSVAVTGQEAG